MNTHFRSIFIYLSLIPLIIMGTQPLTFFNPSPSLDSDSRSIDEEMNPNTSFRSSPVMFVENAGQFEDEVRYKVLGAGNQMWLTKNALWMTILEQVEQYPRQSTPESIESSERTYPGKGVNLKLTFVDANPAPKLQPLDRLDTHLSYFIGNTPDRWKANLPVWGGIRYQDLYPGIDLELSSQSGEFAWRIIIKDAPLEARCSSLESLQLQVEGADAITLYGDHLKLSTPIGEYRLPLFQVEGDLELPAPIVQGSRVESPFTSNPPVTKALENSTSVPSNPPYSTFLGGSDGDLAYDIAVDAGGRVYITGMTRSSDFPVTPGVFDTTHEDGYKWEGYDVFVAKLNKTGSSLIYATYIGGDDDDRPHGIALDSKNNAYITGHTWSSDFPATPGAFSNVRSWATDAFVVKLNPTGSALVYSTFLGGFDDERGNDIALDGSDNAYVTGETYSDNFPVTAGAFDTTLNNGSGNYFKDAFVTKLNSAGSALIYSTYLGGIEEGDSGYGIAVNRGGYAFVIGTTFAHDFPTTADAYDTTFNGGMSDVFVVKFNPSGSALDYATYLGGNGYDWGDSIALDAASCSFLGINTQSTDFPTTLGAYQDTPSGEVDIAVLKLNYSGSELLYSTYLGGSADDFTNQIATDGMGYVYLTGETQSTDFPTTIGAFDITHNGNNDAIGVKIDPTSSALAYSTFLGGFSYDAGEGIALDSAHNVYLTGTTSSFNFPVTPGAFDTSMESTDVFVLKTGMLEHVFLPIIEN